MSDAQEKMAASMCERVRQSTADRIGGHDCLPLAKALNELCARVGAAGASIDQEIANFTKVYEEVLGEPAPKLLLSAAAMRPAFADHKTEAARRAEFARVELALGKALAIDLDGALGDSPEAVDDVAAMVCGICLIDRSIAIDDAARRGSPIPDNFMAERLAGATPALGDRLLAAVGESTRSLAAASNSLSTSVGICAPATVGWPRFAGWPAAALAVVATDAGAAATAFMCVCKKTTDADLLWLVNSPKSSRADIVRFAVAAGVTHYAFVVATALVDRAVASRFIFPPVLI